VSKLVILDVFNKVFEECPTYQQIVRINDSLDALDKSSPDEMFLNGFFYMFILNDPMIRMYLETQKSDPRCYVHSLIEEWEEFKLTFLTEWTNIMLQL
jgi:hypothetical protein